MRERVRSSIGSWTGDVLRKYWAGGVICAAVGDGSTIGIGDGSTLGGGITLGGCTTLGCGTTLGFGTTLGGGNTIGLVDVGVIAVLVFQWSKRSRSLDISKS